MLRVLLEANLGANIGIIDQLTESVQTDRANPREERTDTYRQKTRNDGSAAAQAEHLYEGEDDG